MAADLPSHVYYLDNKMIEAYYNMEERFDRDEQIEILEQDTLINYFKQMRKELHYLVSLPFVKFWAEIVKDAQVLDFLDDFLANVRKCNDVYKLQISSLQNKSKDQSGMHKLLLKDNMNKVLSLVLAIFYRLS